MQEAIPYRKCPPSSDGGSAGELLKGEERVKQLVTENAVIVFGRRGCCMCHVVKRLLLGLGANPAVFEVDEDDEAGVVDQMSRIAGTEGGIGNGKEQFPAVFVGGKLFGGLDRIMATHISGELVPLLKQAGAIWL